MHAWTIRNTFACAVALAALTVATGCNRTQSESTTGTTGRAIQVEEIDLGRSLNTDRSIADNTSSFKPNDTIYVSVKTDGSSASAQLKTRWTHVDSNQLVDESSQVISPTGETRTEFHIAKPDGFPPGKYKVEVFLNDQRAGEKEFEVERP